MMHRTDVSPTAFQCRSCVARGCSACTRSAAELGAIFMITLDWPTEVPLPGPVAPVAPLELTSCSS